MRLSHTRCDRRSEGLTPSLFITLQSPLSNHRTDQFGGSLPNRLRLALTVARAVREVWKKPLFFRLSATDWHEGPEKANDEWVSWGVELSIVLSKGLKVG